MFLLKKLFCFVACFMMIKWTFLHTFYKINWNCMCLIGKIYDNITFFSVYKRLASMVQMRGSRNFHQGKGRVQVSLTKKL